MHIWHIQEVLYSLMFWYLCPFSKQSRLSQTCLKTCIKSFDLPRLKPIFSTLSFVISVQILTFPWMEWNKRLDSKGSSPSPNQYSSRAPSRSAIR